MCSVFFKESNKLNNLRQKKIDLNNGLQFGTCMAITEYATPKIYSLKRDTEGNFKSVIKINHILSSTPVFAGLRVAHLLVLCVVLLCFVTFQVPCCDVRYDFHIKRCSDRL